MADRSANRYFKRLSSKRARNAKEENSRAERLLRLKTGNSSIHDNRLVCPYEKHITTRTNTFK